MNVSQIEDLAQLTWNAAYLSNGAFVKWFIDNVGTHLIIPTKSKRQEWEEKRDAWTKKYAAVPIQYPGHFSAFEDLCPPPQETE